MSRTFTPIATAGGKVLSNEQLESFNATGYIIIDGLLDESEIAKIKALRDQAEQTAKEHRGSFKQGVAEYDVEPLASDPTGETFALRKIQEAWQVEPQFKEVTSSDKLLDVVGDLIGPEIYYHSSKLMCKPANGGRRKPWHQDYAYWDDFDDVQQVTVWIAIDKATTENGCMQIIPGSHTRGLIPHHQAEDFMIDETNISNENVVIAQMNPGDVLIFNVLALHASDPNHSNAPRLSAIIDFASKPFKNQSGFGSLTLMRSA